MDSLGELVSAGGKRLLGVAAVCFVHMGVSYYFARRQPEAPKDKNADIKFCPYNKSNDGESESTQIERQSTLAGKSKKLVRLFCDKLSKDEVLSKYFHKRVLEEESLYSVTLEKYLLVNFSDTYVQMPFDLRDKHHGMKIPKEHFWRWVHLLQASMKELGIEDKPSIWDELQDDIVEAA